MFSNYTICRRAVFLAALLLTVAPAWAIEIDDAKAQGLVGETNTGYLAAVNPPASAEVQALIDDVNGKRLAAFQQAAERTDATLLQVQIRFYELAVQKTRPGHYYQDTEGRWKKK